MMNKDALDLILKIWTNLINYKNESLHMIATGPGMLLHHVERNHNAFCNHCFFTWTTVLTVHIKTALLWWIMGLRDCLFLCCTLQKLMVLFPIKSLHFRQSILNPFFHGRCIPTPKFEDMEHWYHESLSQFTKNFIDKIQNVLSLPSNIIFALYRQCIIL